MKHHLLKIKYKETSKTGSDDRTLSPYLGPPPSGSLLRSPRHWPLSLWSRTFIAVIFLAVSFLKYKGAVAKPVSSSKKIALQFSYQDTLSPALTGKEVIFSGESLRKEFERGDIDTVLTMTPHIEKEVPTPNGGSRKEISIMVNVKNFREGDLISEASNEVSVQDGELAKLSTKDSRLSDIYQISITPKTQQ